MVHCSLLPEHDAETLTDAFFQACQEHQSEVAMMVKLGCVEVCHLPLEHQTSYITVQHPFTEETITVCQDCQALRVDALRNPPTEIHARINLSHGSEPQPRTENAGEPGN